MKRISSIAFGFAACLAFSVTVVAGSGAAMAGDAELSGEARKQLAAARAASARYHDINVALAEGYIDVDFCMPQMGYHFLRPDLLEDGVFDPSKPEILVYAPSPTANKMRLVALEYAVPLQLSDDPPEGFDGPFDFWNEDLGFGLWTLHAWTWLQNPDGVFAPRNPRVNVSCD